MNAGLFDLTGRTALVTGSTRGLGLALAQALAAAGARVAINGRAAATAAEVAAGIPGAIAAPFDVTDEAAVADAASQLGPVDILVNNAGMTLRGSLEACSLEDWRRVLDVNVTSAFLVSRAFAPAMIDRRSGKIVNVCSLMSAAARETTGPYAASKGALKMLTQAMCADWARHGIQANGIGPGYFRTELTEGLQADPSFDAWVRRRVPAQRWGEPRELAGAIVFLCSRASDFVNGQIVYVDGGLLAVV